MDGLGRGDSGASLGGCGGVEDFLRVKIGIGSKKSNVQGLGLWMGGNGSSGCWHLVLTGRPNSSSFYARVINTRFSILHLVLDEQ